VKNHLKSHFLTTKDYLVSGEEFSLLYDHENEMLQTDPQPHKDNLRNYYNSTAYISHTDSHEGFVAILYQWVKKRALRKKTALITTLNFGPGKLLDIGAGTGEFLLSAKKKGWKVNGVEPNNKARILASAKGIELIKTLEEIKGNSYHVITLWHVLEHLPDLKETIQSIERLLITEGILIIAVPNFKSYDAKHYKKYWAAYDVPRHLWHFSRKSMRILFSEKLKLKKINPLVFDSFYVSLLSEKNKTGSSFFFKAFFIGLWSNISAWRTKEYSSLIYCYKKVK